MTRAFGGLLVATMVVVCAPERAHACGGFFCNSAPALQAGERIVYSFEDDGTVVMTVEVDFDGALGDFAWILPVVAPPVEIGIGAPGLFDAIEDATAPTFVMETRTDGTCRAAPACMPRPHGGGLACGGASDEGPGPADAGVIAFPDGAAPPPVTVHSMSTIGPYDTVVLGGMTAADVVAWLEDNGYDIPANTTPLLEPYAADGHVFVALKLSANAATGVLRPVTLRIPTDEACLPVRLTAIASALTLPITAYFLADTYVAPYNYATAVIDLVDPAFYVGGRTWRSAVATEADRLGGHAFAVDYAGPTPELLVALPSVSDLAKSASAEAFVGALAARGYPGEPILYELLERFLDLPMSQTGESYFSCVVTGRACVPAGGDFSGLAAAIDTEITEPSRDAQAMLDAHPALTRLYTELDPAEMTIDPLFRPEPRMPATPNEHSATLVTDCTRGHYVGSAPTHWEIGDARVDAAPGITVGDAERYCAARGLDVAEREGCGVAGTGGALPLVAVIFALLLRRGGRRRRARTP